MVETSKPDLTRVWAEGAPVGNVVDPDVTSPGKYDSGWIAEVPDFEHFNYMFKVFTQGLVHANEQGIGFWDTVSNYAQHGLAKGSDGNIYRSLIADNLNNDPTTDFVNWEIAFYPSSAFKYGRKNLLINGRFDLWQRATTDAGAISNISTYDTDDRWLNAFKGTTRDSERKDFVLGQTDVPGEPLYYSRTNYVGGGAIDDYCFKSQFIEDATTLAGEKAVLSFYAKADAAKDIAVQLKRHYGFPGGSASESIVVNTISLTATWERYEIVLDIPSLLGKTIGIGVDNSLQIKFWSSAGSNFNSDTNSLGNQNIIFDISNIQLEPGIVYTGFEQRVYAEELRLCQRYFWKSDLSLDAYSYGGAGANSTPIRQNFPVTMIGPTVNITEVGSPTAYNNCSHVGFSSRKDGFTHLVSVTATGDYNVLGTEYEAESEMYTA